MTRHDIITLPHSNLRIRSKRIGHIDADVIKLIENMQTATLDWEDNRKHEVGVALAAVQVNALLRIIIVRNDFDNKSDRNFHVFINPKIVKHSGELITDFEGCLSIKDIYGKVPRYNKIKIEAVGLNNKPVRVTAEGFLSRVLQHEIDHINGKLFIDHIKDIPDSFYCLSENGHLTKLDYDKDIKNNSILW
jgi:peptide deformylase